MAELKIAVRDMGEQLTLCMHKMQRLAGSGAANASQSASQSCALLWQSLTLPDSCANRRVLWVAIASRADLGAMCPTLTLTHQTALQIDRCFGFETAVEEAQKALMAAKVEAQSAYRGVGVVKLMGRSSGFIAMNASMASGETHSDSK